MLTDSWTSLDSNAFLYLKLYSTQLAVHSMISPKIEQNAMEMVADFLRVYSKKFFIKVKFKVFFDKCNRHFLHAEYSEQNPNKDQELPQRYEG